MPSNSNYTGNHGFPLSRLGRSTQVGEDGEKHSSMGRVGRDTQVGEGGKIHSRRGGWGGALKQGRMVRGDQVVEDGKG